MVDVAASYTQRVSANGDALPMYIPGRNNTCSTALFLTYVASTDRCRTAEDVHAGIGGTPAQAGTTRVRHAHVAAAGNVRRVATAARRVAAVASMWPETAATIERGGGGVWGMVQTANVQNKATPAPCATRTTKGKQKNVAKWIPGFQAKLVNQVHNTSPLLTLCTSTACAASASSIRQNRNAPRAKSFVEQVLHLVTFEWMSPQPP